MNMISKFRTPLFVCTLVSAIALVSSAEQEAPSKTVTAPDIWIEEAAMTGNTEAVRQHIAAGTDINIRNPMSGATPLIAATTFGHTETAKVLIEGGADLEVKNNEGAIPLDTVAGPFDYLKPIYEMLQMVLGPYGLELDHEFIKETRPKIADILRAE